MGRDRSEQLDSLDIFSDFLAARYRKLVGRALGNLALEEWVALRDDERVAKLANIALGRTE